MALVTPGAAMFLVRAVCDQAMQVYIKAEVFAS